MGTRDKRIDAYIAKSADFAQPILRELREVVHEGCPEVEETMKWSFPHFMYKGMFCSMASFKQHCAFGFWKRDLVIGAQDAQDAKNAKAAKAAKENKSVDAMGQFGRIVSRQDLPARRVLLSYVRKAVQLNDQGVKNPARPKPQTGKKDLKIPDYFMASVKKNKKAHAIFEGFPYSKKKDYVEWVTEAKTEETRQRRLETSVEWLSQGKSRNWKYERC